jgi:rhamnulokinase
MVAVDLGAESGRAVVGTFDGGRLTLEDVHRFPNVPVTVRDPPLGLLRPFGEVTAGLRAATAGRSSVGVTPGRGLRPRRPGRSGQPGPLPDRRTDGMPELARVVPRDEIYAADGHPVHAINTLYQLFSMVRAGDPG